MVLRTRIAFLFCVLFALIVVVKISIVQIKDGEKWRKKAEQVSLRYMSIKANRGNILSDNGSLLATSIPRYKLFMDPTDKAIHDTVFNKGIDSLSLKLSRFFGDKSQTEYKRKIKDGRVSGERYLALGNRQVSHEEKIEIMKWPIFRKGRYKGGAIFERFETRYKPFNMLALRTLGFINEDNQGAGLEFSFNKMLGGKDGEALFRKLAGGSWKPLHNDEETIAEHGYDIQTTIDVNLQDVAESSLEYHLTKHDAEYGCVVLMEVKTGEIKAIANLGKDENGVYRERYNYAVGNQGLTDPGSTFKLASMMALLEDKNIELNDSVDCGKGRFKFFDRYMEDASYDKGGYGRLTVRDVFAKSSNIGVAKLIQEQFAHKPNKFMDYISNFGLDKPINFQMAGEAKPYIKRPSDKTWSGISLLWMSIGYEMKLSPIHTLTFYNAVANNGKMIQPIIVKNVFKSDKTVQTFKTKVLNEKICSDQTLEKVKDMMVEVVESGTASNIKNENYKIAGKTGTAQILENKSYVRRYYTSFCGFFPAEEPKYSCIVVISKPKDINMMARDVCAPVFKEVADKIYALDPAMHKLLKEPEQPKMFDFPVVRAGFGEDIKKLCNEFGISNHSSTEEEWVAANIHNNAIIWRGRKMIQNLMPDVTGMTIKDALYILENKGIKVKYSGLGRVSAQSIQPGVRINKGNIVYLKLG
ncbi:MAG: penicillin-binding protein [Bacteroidota bacterium]|nr:penicillin-binding protein [Bacteroidota bacterium]